MSYIDLFTIYPTMAPDRITVDRPDSYISDHMYLVQVDTTVPGYDRAVRRAIFEINGGMAAWRDDALIAMDQGYKWGKQWYNDRWRAKIVKSNVRKGLYLIHIIFNRYHFWSTVARHLKNMINGNGSYGRPYVISITDIMGRNRKTFRRGRRT